MTQRAGGGCRRSGRWFRAGPSVRGAGAAPGSGQGALDDVRVGRVGAADAFEGALQLGVLMRGRLARGRGAEQAGETMAARGCGGHSEARWGRRSIVEAPGPAAAPQPRQ